MNFKKFIAMMLVMVVFFCFINVGFCSAKNENWLKLDPIKIGAGKTECFKQWIKSITLNETNPCRLKTVVLTDKNRDVSVFMKGEAGWAKFGEKQINGLTFVEYVLNNTNYIDKIEVCVKNNDEKKVSAQGFINSECELKKYGEEVKEKKSFWEILFYIWMTFAVPSFVFGVLTEFLNGIGNFLNSN